MARLYCTTRRPVSSWHGPAVPAWLVYADGVREHVEAARRRQAEREPGPQHRGPARSRPAGKPGQPAHRPAVTRDEIRRLRAERDKLRAYVHADMTIKEKALGLTTPATARPGRYQPADKILAFLESL
jgi:hypothetical protein